MNRLILFAALLACAFAKPQYLPTPYAAAPYHYGYAAAPYAAAPHYGYAAHPGYAPTYASQYHSQDELGSAAYGYAQPDQAHSAVRDYTGAVRGRYQYIDAEGKAVFTDYIADHNGFRVLSNNLPVGPENNLEAPVFNLVAPSPVEDTPEVKAAKEAHFAAVAEAKAATSERKKRDLPYAAAPHYGHGFAYSFGTPLAHGAFPYARALPYAHGALPYAHGALPYAHGALPYAHGALPYAYGAAPYAHAYAAPAVVGREATLTKVILNPGHAEAYRVD